MTARVVVLAPGERVGFAEAGPRTESAFVHYVNEHGRKIEHGRNVECFAWRELVVLEAARKLREAPTAVVATTLGKLLLRAHGRDQEKSGREVRDVVSFHPYEREPRRYESREPLVVNGVALRVSGTLYRGREGWEVDWTLYADRVKRLKNGDYLATEAARTKIRAVLTRELGAWLAKRPHWLEEARAVVLSNEIAGVEGDILAAKARYQRAGARRTELLAREARS